MTQTPRRSVPRTGKAHKISDFTDAQEGTFCTCPQRTGPAVTWTTESGLVAWLSDLPLPRSLRGTGGTGVWNPDKQGSSS